MVWALRRPDAEAMHVKAPKGDQIQCVSSTLPLVPSPICGAHGASSASPHLEDEDATRERGDC